MASKVGTAAVDMIAGATYTVVCTRMEETYGQYGTDWIQWTAEEVDTALRTSGKAPASAKGLERWISEALVAAHRVFAHYAPAVAGTAQEFADEILSTLEDS